MKNFKTFLLCFAILISHSITFAQSKYNLNFDDFNSEKQVMPNGWFKWGDFKNLTGEKINDNCVGKIVSDDNGKFGCITYKIPANYVGDTIILTGRIKYEKVKEYVGLMIRIDGNNSSLVLENMQNLKIKGTNDWKQYSIKLPYPVRAENIYVGGILAGTGTAWFDDFKVSIDGKDIQTMQETPLIYLENYDKQKLNTAIVKSSTPINLATSDSLWASMTPLIEKLGDKKIISIGESTHGTSEFYQLREAITKRLIQEKGFNMVVLENPYDDIELLNKEIATNSLDTIIKNHLFSIYQTKEMKSFLQWYKDNRSKYNVRFKGCDDSVWVLYEVLSANLTEIKDERLDGLMNKLKSNIIKSSKASSKEELTLGVVIYNSMESIENYLKSINKLTKPVQEILFNGKNTYVNFVNSKNNTRYQSRDEIMADRISYLAKDPNNKIIVWAHNAHISNEIIQDEEIGIMGRDLKTEFGNGYHSIGLSTWKGSYSFIDQNFINGDHFYKDELKKAFILPTEITFWESAFAKNGKAFYLNFESLKKELNTDTILGLVKFIGYSKETKNNIYNLPLIMNFDSLLFIENTNATTPIFN